MSGLAFLPSELLRDILAYIFGPTCGTVSDRHHAFAGLARSCRALDSISTQCLYSRYESPLEQPLPGFLRRLSYDKDHYHTLKHVNIRPNAGLVQ